MGKKNLDFSLDLNKAKGAKAEKPSTSDIQGDGYDLSASAEAIADQLPSMEEMRMRAMLKDRRQFNFSRVPGFVIELFGKGMEETGKSKIQYLYHLLREVHGEDKIPPDEMMDVRKWG